MHDQWQKAGLPGPIQGVLGDFHIDIAERHNDDKDQVEVLQDNEDVEVRVVLQADAIVDPLAVMVESLHTLVANVAMA